MKLDSVSSSIIRLKGVGDGVDLSGEDSSQEFFIYSIMIFRRTFSDSGTPKYSDLNLESEKVANFVFCSKDSKRVSNSISKKF